ncbi:MAG: hypothetical protein L7V87_07260 [Verrucomicrobiales bacterium]|jgi:cell division protein FtsB|nr:hypothetical protein [Verrucomicrobiales bacterium]
MNEDEFTNEEVVESAPVAPASAWREELQEEIASLRAEVASLRGEIDELKTNLGV